MLQVENLSVDFRVDSGWIRSVDEVSFALDAQSTLGIVGESGSGKSVTALSILRLHARRNTRMTGRIVFDGEDLLAMPERRLHEMRGRDIAMIFQDPMHSLNPVLTIGDQIGETLRIHQGLNRAAAEKAAAGLLDMVRIPDAKRRVTDFPHQLSGGMRQRVMIAMAIACRPRLLIADEPTTALDVTVQAQILDLLRDLREEIGMAVILISHDLGLVAEFAERVLVMYAGELVEDAPARNIFEAPAHPYSEGLLKAIPSADVDMHRLYAIPGRIPDPGDRPPGCNFAPRCALAQPACSATPPALDTLAPGHRIRCPVRLAAREPAA
ncbi:ATP-binding cassette domain-containing protein [Pseudooceanicola sp. 216_PA32_1]|uniref:ATP-binding cassette domain-containing protein n=1 Tax=Pseudooceanicola pacificus TaxID=2676438 RepID=A0A844W6L0_9RHOB|nr:ABC transporter ATP-binding protein [Pseudooceanicola pacificus]MWB78384.1 ATP-binding cassette domain-containing protein [Pseudooceanicola pacificus]